MAYSRPRSLLSAGLAIAAMQLFGCGAAVAADAGTAVDVPDEFGLGERLALVAWLKDHQIRVADPNDIPTLRRLYSAKAHPETATVTEDQAKQDQLRADLAAELYRRFGRNSPAGASIADITALMTSLTAHEDEVVANDQRIAHTNALAHPRSSAPAAPAPAPTGPSGPPPSTATAPAPGTLPGVAAPQGGARLAAGIALGKPFPALSGTCIDGSQVASADWKGKIVLVDVWATWCAPCMHEMPNVITAYHDFHPLGLEIVGISMDNDALRLRAGLTVNHIEWPQIMEPFAAKGPWATTLVITSIPSNFLLDRNGVIIAMDLRGAALHDTLAKVFGQAP